MNDEQDEAQDYVPDNVGLPRRLTPSPTSGLRNRFPSKAGVDAPAKSDRRSSSFISETLSESRASLKASTDDLLLPRAELDRQTNLESTNWHSLPLGLALLPAVGGLFFQNGSAFVTDVTLLALAAIFLNWAVRLPWDWYLSAQAVVVATENSDIEFESDNATDSAIQDDVMLRRSKAGKSVEAAEAELRMHEVTALAACFIFPALGAWLLHGIRSQLSRPSEGLVSDYNLTIFLLASEIRPLSHAIKLVQRRTLFLQRTISTSAKVGTDVRQDHKIAEIAKRMEELEIILAESMSTFNPESEIAKPQEMIAKTSLLVSEDMKRLFQPEVDALSRAMRRYEKKITISTIQTEARLQDIEAKMRDIVVLAAATQRNVDRSAARYTTILVGWLSALIVIPTRYVIHIFTLPQRMLVRGWYFVGKKLGFMSNQSTWMNGKSGYESSSTRRKIREKRSKAAA